MGERDTKGPESTLEALARTSGHGLTIALATGLFLLVGWWVDGRLGTTPVLTILGALIGAAAGFYSMYQHLVLRPGREEREGRERREREPGARVPAEPQAKGSAVRSDPERQAKDAAKRSDPELQAKDSAEQTDGDRQEGGGDGGTEARRPEAGPP